MAGMIEETQCGARHPKYVDVRCDQNMDRHRAYHEARDGSIVWALDAVHSNAQCRSVTPMAGSGRETTVELGPR